MSERAASEIVAGDILADYRVVQAVGPPDGRGRRDITIDGQTLKYAPNYVFGLTDDWRHLAIEAIVADSETPIRTRNILESYRPAEEP